ncbi:hypothetical protein VE04_01879 [Pseudogymnoascus sp. 24MN13]|nr:hypothetical protein VE04_01879 [Pseudogymnoascus sp. 24MN13]
MAFGSRLISKLRPKKGDVGEKDGAKTENHHISTTSNPQSTTPTPPAVIEASQKSTIAAAQADPISVDEARDEIAKSLRGKYPHSELIQGGGPFSQVHSPGQSLVKAQRMLEESFMSLHATLKESTEYYVGVSVGDDAVKQAVAVASNEPLTSADSYSRVIAKALLKDEAQQDTISGRTRICMSKVFPVLSVVLGVVSFSADAAGLLPLKITANALSQVVTLASNDHSSSVAVVEGLEELSDHQQFLNSVSSLNFELDNGTDSILVKATNLLAAITDFLRISIQFLQRNFVQRVWDQVTTDHVNTAMKSLQDARQNFDLAVHGAASATILRRENEAVTRKALHDMSPLTFKKTHDDVVINRLENSGQWLLEHQNFDKWLRGDLLTLWCPGKGGAGKTFLTSVVIDHVDSYLKSQRETQPDKRVGPVYLYCRFQNEAEQTVLKFIPAIIQQLAAQDLSAVSQVKKFNAKHVTQPATVDQYTSFLSELLDSFSAVYLMVDALDEFSKSEYEKKLFVQELLSLSSTRTTLRIFITSRPDHDIAQELGGENVDIEASEMDIHAYIERAIKTNSAWKSWVGKRPELRTKMLATIPKKARKIFQLAKMQIDHLETEYTVEDVIDALDSLSENVNDYYKMSIERIERMSEARDKDIINIILKWVYFAKRPLRVDEICHILAVKPKNTSATRLRRIVESNAGSWLQTFIDRSAGLLTIREESQIVSVAHPTVQEYLKTLEATLLSTAEQEISERRICFRVDPIYQRLSEFPFVEYASIFWGDHLRGKPEENTALQDLALDFLKNEQLLSSSVQIALVSPAIDRSDGMLGIYSGQRFFGRDAPENGTGIEERGNDGDTALYQASLMGHEPAVNLLLDKGADINAQGGDFNNALQAASHGGHSRVVKLLLERGANVNAKGGSYREHLSALFSASLAGHVQVVIALLNAGAEVDASRGDSENPLRAAAAEGHTAIVKILLDKGANINARSGNWQGNALSVASRRGHIGVVKLLLQNKAPKVEVNLKDRFGYDALHAATRSGHEAIVGLLIESGADVNANGSLKEASLLERMGIVKLLLQNGADVNGDKRWGYPLQAAAGSGHEAIVALLLEKGANVNAPGGDADYAGNALQAACYEGCEATVRLLLKNGADVNTQRETYRLNTKNMFALQFAASQGHVAVAQLLLEEGADVNAEGMHSQTALRAAAKGGHEDMVKLLLKWGATANLEDERWKKLRVSHRGVEDTVMESILDLIESYPRG